MSGVLSLLCSTVNIHIITYVLTVFVFFFYPNLFDPIVAMCPSAFSDMYPSKILLASYWKNLKPGTDIFFFFIIFSSITASSGRGMRRRKNIWGLLPAIVQWGLKAMIWRRKKRKDMKRRLPSRLLPSLLWCHLIQLNMKGQGTVSFDSLFF